MTDLILHNAQVLTMDPSRPQARLVAVSEGRIQAVGREEDLPRLSAPGARLVDCGGATVLPAFHDAHCHLLALASHLLGVDCSPWRVASISEVQAALRRQAEGTPAGRWIRARGYHEALLRERRHPTRQELDQAAPHHPVKLTHQTGHASVLNSLALALVGIHRETPDPVEGVIERDPITGEPTGLLLEMEAYLEGRLPSLESAEMERGVRLARDLLLSYGVTAVQDATPANSVERWRLWQGLQERGLFPLRLTLMPGVEHLAAFGALGLAFGAERGRLRLGHAKLVLTLTTGALHPPMEVLRAQVLEAAGRGFPVAVHAVEAEAIEAALEALKHADVAAPGLRHRLEHASEASRAVTKELARRGWVVATQPGFLFYNGDRYLQEVPADRHESLYPLRWLVEAGVPVAASSDAPVAPPDPLAGLYAAVARRSSSGREVNPGQRVGALDALRMSTAGAAYAAGLEASLGAIQVGKMADLVVLDGNPLEVAPEALKKLRVLMTVLAGEVVWER